MVNLIKTLNRRLLVFLALLSLGGCVVVWLATSTYGAGLSSDAIRILSTGQNFIEGRGLINTTGDPLIFCPPYYSIFMGVLSVVFHSDVFTVAMYLNILVFGAIIFSSGILFSLIKPEKPIYVILGSLVVFTSPSLIRISANVAPDPLFILFVVLFLIEAVLFMRNPSPRKFWGLLITALLAASQRYVGMAAVLTGAIVILWVQRKTPWHALRNTTIFSLLSSAPSLAYIIFHNYLRYGTFTGPRFDPRPLGNFRLAMEKIEHWFIPGTITQITGNLVWAEIALILLLIGLAIAWKHKRLEHVLDSNAFLPTLVFSITYGACLITLLSYKEHRPLLWDRVHIVLLIPILILMMELLPVLVPPFPAARTRQVMSLLLVGISLWLVYPVASTTRYVVDSIKENEASLYNIHNTRPIRESELAQYLANHPFSQNAGLYSNYNETAWFLTRRQVKGVPNARNMAGWPEMNGPTYLIWFDLPQLSYMPKTMLTLNGIQKIIHLTLVYSGKDGAVYQMTPFSAQ
jgi:hypothetical protein